MHAKPAPFVLCVNNGEYPASLEVWKIYRTVPDEKAVRRNFVRVIDESGEDYLYPVELFVPIRVPMVARKVLLANERRASPRVAVILH